MLTKPKVIGLFSSSLLKTENRSSLKEDSQAKQIHGDAGSPRRAGITIGFYWETT
jgi:hypothetical protein